MTGFLLLALALSPGSATWACGTDDSDLIDNTLLDPLAVAGEAWEPFFYTTSHTFYSDEDKSNAAHVLDEANLAEWVAFFGDRVKADAWKQLLERGTVEAVSGLLEHPTPAAYGAMLTDPSDPASRHMLTAALHYLVVAKQADRVVPAVSEDWSYVPEPSRAPQIAESELTDWLGAAKAGADEAPYDFLRQRYAFQATKILFFRKRHEDCIAYFQSHRSRLEGGSIGWRAMGYCAGSLWQLKRYAEANYLYSLIYDQCPPLKLSAYWSFHPQEEADWQQSLALARTPREQQVLWQMMGLHDDGQRALERIYALDPRSDLLPILASREVNRLETQLDWKERTIEGEDGEGGDRVRSLTAMVDRIVNEAKTADPSVWTLVAAHLHGMTGEAARSLALYDATEQLSPRRPEVLREARLGRLMADIMGMDEPRRMSAKLASELMWLKAETERHDEPERSDNLFAGVRRRLSHLFAKAGDPYMALYLDEGDHYDFKAQTARDYRKLQHIVAFLDRRDKTPVERFAAACFPYRRGDLIEAMAMDQLYWAHPEKAEPLFAQVSTAVLPGDPFIIHMQDCHDCDHEAPQTRHYTKAQFVRTVLDLEARAAKRHDARDYFQLGNAFYNITYFGNARAMYAGAYLDLDNDPRVMSTQTALSYYLLAMKHARDPEFRAMCCFMAAKCEQAELIRKDPDPWDRVFIPTTYFKQLASSFSRTRYYQEVLAECGYFSQFLDEHRR